MSRILRDMEHIDRALTDRPLIQAPYSLSTPNSFGYENESTPSSSASRISPVLLLVMIILAVIFFVSGLVHLLVRCLKEIPSPLPNHQSNRFSETPFPRQLQQLFRLHDSGLDQALIDALPVFYYKDIVGLKEPFDCAVCLCEFSEHDKLRLLPSCSHAFHIACIDTWLLSNSSCPLCRGNLLGSGNSLEIPVSSFEVLREISNGYTTDEENGFSGRHQRPEIVQESAAPKRVFSVKLGKMKSMKGDDRERVQGEISGRSINMDTRRCYSMGAFQYVLVDSDLQVAMDNHNNVASDGKGNSSPDGELEGKRITGRARGESYSVSKIWLWSKKSKLPSSSSNPQMAGLASSLYYYKFPHELQSS